MDIERKRALLEESLERAAECVGDITEPVLQAFYPQFPEMRQIFREWDPLGKVRLEAQMVEQSLYCLMNIFDRADEISIIVHDSVPYHRLVLNVSPEAFGAMMDATCDIIVETIPDDARDERALWDEIRAKMRALVMEGAKENWTYKPAASISGPSGAVSRETAKGR